MHKRSGKLVQTLKFSCRARTYFYRPRVVINSCGLKSGHIPTNVTLAAGHLPPCLVQSTVVVDVTDLKVGRCFGVHQLEPGPKGTMIAWGCGPANSIQYVRYTFLPNQRLGSREMTIQIEYLQKVIYLLNVKSIASSGARMGSLEHSFLAAGVKVKSARCIPSKVLMQYFKQDTSTR